MNTSQPLQVAGKANAMRILTDLAEKARKVNFDEHKQAVYAYDGGLYWLSARKWSKGSPTVFRIDGDIMAKTDIAAKLACIAEL